MANSSLIVFFVLLATVFAEVVKIKSCEGVDQTKCSVGEVRIDPCPKYVKNNNKCVFNKGKDGTNATLSFDFIPNFSASNLKTYVFWNNGVIDVAFPDMGSDNACLYTTCPSEAGKSQTLDYTLRISSKLPKGWEGANLFGRSNSYNSDRTSLQGTYEFKWKVWDDDDKVNECCFMTTVQLKK